MKYGPHLAMHVANGRAHEGRPAFIDEGAAQSETEVGRFSWFWDLSELSLIGVFSKTFLWGCSLLFGSRLKFEVSWLQGNPGA